MTIGSLQGLGYLGIQTAALAEWRRFGTGLLGLQATEESRGSLTFRMDDVARRLFLREASGDAVEFFGWEVRDAAALDALAARLEAHGFATRPTSSTPMRVITALHSSRVPTAGCIT